MFKAKNQHNLIQILIAAILTIFVAGQFLALAHSFSHDEITAKEVPAKQHEKRDCNLCFLAHSFSQTIFTAVLTFGAVYFLVNFALRKFDLVKLSYLFSLNLSRAPPAIS
jgi:hypothetical protein